MVHTILVRSDEGRAMVVLGSGGSSGSRAYSLASARRGGVAVEKDRLKILCTIITSRCTDVMRDHAAFATIFCTP